METVKNKETKPKAKSTVIANPAVKEEGETGQKQALTPDSRHIVKWSGEENSLPYYLL
jgi:hypothetical protein